MSLPPTALGVSGVGGSLGVSPGSVVGQGRSTMQTCTMHVSVFTPSRERAGGEYGDEGQTRAKAEL